MFFTFIWRQSSNFNDLIQKHSLQLDRNFTRRTKTLDWSLSGLMAHQKNFNMGPGGLTLPVLSKPNCLLNDLSFDVDGRARPSSTVTTPRRFRRRVTRRPKSNCVALNHEGFAFCFQHVEITRAVALVRMFHFDWMRRHQQNVTRRFVPKLRKKSCRVTLFRDVWTPRRLFLEFNRMEIRKN